MTLHTEEIAVQTNAFGFESHVFVRPAEVFKQWTDEASERLRIAPIKDELLSGDDIYFSR